MVTGSHNCSIRVSAGLALSLHTVSALWMKGPGPELGQRALGAAASIEQLVALVGDDNRGLRAIAAASALLDLIGEVVHVDDGRLHAGQR